MESRTEVLALSGDRSLLADLNDALDESFDARVTPVESIDDARQLLAERGFDLLICDGPFDDAAVDLVAEITLEGIPTIVVEHDLVPERLLSALRAGVIDVIPRPIDFLHLERVVAATLEARREARTDRTRQRRLKELSSRMVRDRRLLRQRIDLLCKDLVAAYRRLAEKISAQQTSV
jgi:DNA-binding NtrC family response regulator